MSVLLLVRHAQATFGLGTYDKLSEHGLLQATHVGDTLARRGIKADRIISGDLERQRETAERWVTFALEVASEAPSANADSLRKLGLVQAAALTSKF